MSELKDPASLVQGLRPLRTDMDSFNTLVDTAADFLEGGCQQAELEEQIARVDQDLGHLRLQFEDGLRFQVPTPEIETGTALAYGAFKTLAQRFERLNAALQNNRPYDVARELEICNATVNQLFFAFSNLREHLAQEKYSEAPFINELVRVGKAYLRGQLAAELFQERFDNFCQFHDQFVEALQPLLAQVEGDPRQQQLLDALEEQNLILDEIATHFQDHDSKQLDSALQRLCNSSAVLLEMQAEFQKEEERAKGLLCFRCGHANEQGPKSCTNCGARLIDLQEDGLGSSAAEGGLPSNLRKLIAAAEGYRDGSVDQAGLLEVLAWYDQLTDQGLQQMAELAPPPKEAAKMSQEHQDAYAEAVEAMQLGLDDLKTGVNQLRAYAEKKDPVDLENGIASALSGHEQMLRFAQINDSLKATS
ncbi:hypothetical protein JST97_19660 [bacterium]|nr:hypothetical protein [bacterium]